MDKKYTRVKMMNEKLFFLISILVLIPLVEAKPTISNTNVYPLDSWIGDTLTLSFDCVEENYTIQKFEVWITSPIVARTDFKNQTGNTYFFEFTPPQTGQYNVSFYCESNNQIENITYNSLLFNVYELSGSIDGISPNNIYVNDIITINATVKRNNVKLDGSFINDLSFQVFLDNTNITNINYYYSSINGWIINNINISTNEGAHILKLKVNFQQKNIEITRNIFVNPLVEFYITNIDKTEIFPGDNITVTMIAKYHGTSIDNSYTLSAIIDSISPHNITKIDSSTGTTIITKFHIPLNFSQGEYNLIVSFVYKEFSFSETRKIIYPVKLSGKILSNDGSPVNTQIKLIKDGFDYKMTSTDSSGNYNILASPDKYDIEITFYTDRTFPNAKLYLYSADVKQVDNFVKFEYLKDIAINGIGYGGVYSFEIFLNYSKAILEMTYDDKRIPDNNKIVLYRCNNWNAANKNCNEDLEELNYKLDVSKNLVKLDLDKLSTFIIGYNKELNLNFATDKKEYFLKEPIKINGYVEDEDRNAVSDVNLEIRLSRTNIKYSAKTDINGVFSLEIVSPETEGQFQIEVQASKFPYLSDSSIIDINITKSKKIMIIMDDSVKIKQGENKTIWISLINAGQADLFDLNVKLDGVPNEYFILSPLSVSEIKSGQESKILMDINIPKSSSIMNYLGKISVTSNNINAEKQFLLSIIEDIPTINSSKNSTSLKLPQIELPTTKIILPQTNNNFIIIVLIFITLIIIGYMFKEKKKRTGKKRDEIKNFLLDVSTEIKKTQNM